MTIPKGIKKDHPMRSMYETRERLSTIPSSVRQYEQVCERIDIYEKARPKPKKKK